MTKVAFATQRKCEMRHCTNVHRSLQRTRRSDGWQGKGEKGEGAGANASLREALMWRLPWK